MRRLFTLSALVAVLAALFCTPTTAATPNSAATSSPAQCANVEMFAMLRAALGLAPSDFAAIRGVVKQPGSFSQVWTVTDWFQAICPACPTLVLQALPGPDGTHPTGYDFEMGVVGGSAKVTLPAGSDSAASLQFVKQNFLSWIPSGFTIDTDPQFNGTIGAGGQFTLRYNGPNKETISMQFYPTNFQNTGTQAILTIYVHHSD
jgi:hypothetical protein